MSIFEKIRDYIKETFLIAINGIIILWEYLFCSTESKTTKSEECLASVILEEDPHKQFLSKTDIDETFEILSNSDISDAQNK